MNKFEIAKSYKRLRPIDFLRNLLSYPEITKDSTLVEYIRNIIRQIMEYIKLQRISKFKGANPFSKSGDTVDRDYYDYTKTTAYENDIKGLFRGLKIDNRYMLENIQAEYEELKDFILNKYGEDEAKNILGTVDLNSDNNFVFVVNEEKRTAKFIEKAEYEEIAKYANEQGYDSKILDEVLYEEKENRCLIDPKNEIVMSYYEDKVLKELENIEKESSSEYISGEELKEVLGNIGFPPEEADSLKYVANNHYTTTTPVAEGEDAPLQTNILVISNDELNMFKKYADSKGGKAPSIHSAKGEYSVALVEADSPILNWVKDRSEYIKKRTEEVSLYEQISKKKIAPDTWVRLEQDANPEFKAKVLERISLNPKTASLMSVRFTVVKDKLVKKETDNYVVVELPSGIRIKDKDGNDQIIRTKAESSKTYIRIPKTAIYKTTDKTHMVDMKLSDQFVLVDENDEVKYRNKEALNMSAISVAEHFLLREYKETAPVISSNEILVDGIVMERVSTKDGLDIAYSEELGTAVILGYTGSEYNLVIPNGIKVDGKYYEIVEIKDGAFAGKALESITFPGTITKIGNGALADCTHLTKFVAPENLRVLGDRVLEGCTSLESVTLNAKLGELGKGDFKRCYNLNSFNIENNPLFYTDGRSLFIKRGEGKHLYCFAAGNVADIEKYNEKKTELEAKWERQNQDRRDAVNQMPEEEKKRQESILRIEKDRWVENHIGIDYDIPPDTTSLEPAAFADSRIENLGIPKGITVIPEDTFENCPLIKSMTLPETIISVEKGAYKNSNIETINLENVKSVGERAFYNSNIRSISLNNIERTGREAFAKCYHMNSALINLEHVKEGDFAESTFIDTNNATINYVNRPKREVVIGEHREPEIMEDINGRVEKILKENGIPAKVVAIAPYGSRVYGLANEVKQNSDLDVVVEVELSANVDEKAIDSLNEIIQDENVYIDGVEVDIRFFKSEPDYHMSDFIERVKAYDKPLAQKDIESKQNEQPVRFDDLEANYINQLLNIINVPNSQAYEPDWKNVIKCKIDGVEYTGRKIYEKIEKLLPPDASDEVRKLVEDMKNYHKIEPINFKTLRFRGSEIPRAKLLAELITATMKKEGAVEDEYSYANMVYTDIATNKGQMTEQALIKITTDNDLPEPVRAMAVNSYNWLEMEINPNKINNSAVLTDVLYRTYRGQNEWHNETCVNKDNPNEYFSVDVLKNENTYALTLTHKNGDDVKIETRQYDVSNLETLIKTLFSDLDLDNYMYRETKEIFENYVRFDESNLSEYLNTIPEEDFLPPNGKEAGYQHMQIEQNNEQLHKDMESKVKDIAPDAINKNGEISSITRMAVIKEYLEKHKREFQDITPQEVMTYLTAYESLQEKDENGNLITGNTYEDISNWLEKGKLFTVVSETEIAKKNADRDKIFKNSEEFYEYPRDEFQRAAEGYLINYANQKGYLETLAKKGQPYHEIQSIVNDYLMYVDNFPDGFAYYSLDNFIAWLDKTEAIKNNWGTLDDLMERTNSYYEEKIAKMPVDEDLLAEAKNEKTTPEELENLALHYHYKVREVIAGRPDTPEKTFLMLADDNNLNVKYALINNKYCPLSVIEKLSNDNHPLVRQAAIDKANEMKSIVEEMAKDFEKKADDDFGVIDVSEPRDYEPSDPEVEKKEAPVIKI